MLPAIVARYDAVLCLDADMLVRKPIDWRVFDGHSVAVRRRRDIPPEEGGGWCAGAVFVRCDSTGLRFARRLTDQLRETPSGDYREADR